MSFMNVRVDELIEDGWYEAVPKSVERAENSHGQFLLWRFLILKLNAVVSGFSSTSESSRAKAFEWASKINSEIASRTAWSPEDVVERPCEVFVESYEDGQGRAKNKVTKIRRASK